MKRYILISLDFQMARRNNIIFIYNLFPPERRTNKRTTDVYGTSHDITLQNSSGKESYKLPSQNKVKLHGHRV